MKFKELGLSPLNEAVKIHIQDKELEIKKYISINEKSDLITYVVDHALDNNTGCFSPIRVEVFFSLGVCKWYAGIDFEDMKATEAYDLLEENDILDQIVGVIPEMEFLKELVLDTLNDISRYNSSAAGIITAMSQGSNEMDEQITDILEKIKNAEGIETLSEIRNVLGKQPPINKVPTVIKKSTQG